jgi:tetratricopeptide (TPR) repeat protein
MKLIYLSLLLIPFAASANDAPAAPGSGGFSIVPQGEWMSDSQTRRSYAGTLLTNPESVPEAVNIYQNLLKEDPENFPLSLDLEKALYLRDHPEEASKESKDTMVPKHEWINDLKARKALVEILSNHRKTFLEAIAQWQILLGEDPGNPDYTYQIARIYLNQKRYAEAIEMLGRIEKWPEDPKLQMNIALFMADLGYAKQSNELFSSILAANPEDKDIVLRYGDAMMSWGDFYKAQDIFANALAEKPDSPDIIKRNIDVLIGSQRFEEAEGMALNYRDQHPEMSLKRLVNIYRYLRRYEEALEAIEQLRALDPKEYAYVELKADTLYESENFEEALSCYLTLKDDEEFYPQGALGAGKCYLKLGEASQAKEELEIAVMDFTTARSARYFLEGENVLNRAFICRLIEDAEAVQDYQAWVENYALDGYNDPVFHILTAAVDVDPDYLPGQIGLAESLTVQLDFDSSFNIYHTLSEEFPENPKILIGRARVVSWNKKYSQAIGYYDGLIELNPEDPVPLVERARVAYWGKDYDLAMVYYGALLDALDGDNWGRQLIRRKTLLEMETKELEWNKRNLHRLGPQEELLAMDPSNDNLKFDYAQALCSIGACDEAMDWYADILRTSKLNTLCGMCLERARNKLNVSNCVNYNYWQEIGYGELSQVGRYEGNYVVSVPLNCHEHVRSITRYWNEHTYFDNRYHQAYGESLEYDRRFNDFVTAAGGITYKQFLHRYGATYNCFANANVNVWDYGLLSFAFRKKDVVCNYFNLLQGTQERVYTASLQSYINHRWCINALAEEIDYNDDNNMTHCILESLYAFTDNPRTFKVSLLAEYRNTAHFNKFCYAPDGTLTNIIFPYWTPQNYLLRQIMFEFRHDYNWLEFCGGPAQFYDIKLAFGDDSQNNPYYEIKGEWQHEFYNHWKLGLTGYWHKSPLWKGKGIWSTICYEF